VKFVLPVVAALLAVGCGALQPKNAQGHVIDSAMGDAAPVYGGPGEPIGKFLEGKWGWGFAGPPGTKNANGVLSENHGRPRLSLVFDAKGGAMFGTTTPDHTPIFRKGSWRVNGQNIELTFGEMGGDTSNPVWTKAAEGMATLFNSSLQLDEGRRMLKWVTPSLTDGNAPQGKFVWMRLWQ
jgi:hypothetical protein